MNQTITVVVTPWVASAADYEAIGVLFGVVLAAGVVVYGVRMIFNLLNKTPEA